MKKKNIVVSESQLKNVIDSVISEKSSITPKNVEEQRVRRNNSSTNNGGTTVKSPIKNSPVSIGSEGPGRKVTVTVAKPTTLTAGLFANGVNTIDVNSNEYKQAISAIQQAIKGATTAGGQLTVTVEGGASAVGSATGYDNKKLATSRAQNFITNIQPQFKNVKFVLGTPKVGVNTVKNSSGAQAEQYVKLSYTAQVEDNYQMPAVDNARIRRDNLGLENTVKKMFIVPKDKLNDVVAFLKTIGGSLSS